MLSVPTLFPPLLLLLGKDAHAVFGDCEHSLLSLFHTVIHVYHRGGGWARKQHAMLGLYTQYRDVQGV